MLKYIYSDLNSKEIPIIFQILREKQNFSSINHPTHFYRALPMFPNNNISLLTDFHIDCYIYIQNIIKSNYNQSKKNCECEEEEQKSTLSFIN